MVQRSLAAILGQDDLAQVLYSHLSGGHVPDQVSGQLDICLVSGGDRPRLSSPTNHKIYATLHEMDFRLETGPFANLRSPYYFKLRAVREVLPRYDWVIWMDDDAFVTDFDRPGFQAILDAHASPETVAIFGDSPVNAAGTWTHLNSGVFLLKNCAESFRLLDLALEVPLADVQAWWDEEKYGHFTRGDQDALVWAIETTELRERVGIIAHADINARLYEYPDAVTDNFIVHFPGVPSKEKAIADFGSRWGRGATLVPTELLQRFGVGETRPASSTRRATSVARKVAHRAKATLQAARQQG